MLVIALSFIVIIPSTPSDILLIKKFSSEVSLTLFTSKFLKIIELTKFGDLESTDI